MPIKIIGVSCSPRKGKSSMFALETCLSFAEKTSDYLTTELIDLADIKVNPCTACGKCRKELACSQVDDFQKLIPVISDPQVAGLILSTPVYMGTMTAQAKAFLDRCVLFRRNGAILRNKVGGVIAIGGFRNGGQELTIQAIHASMLVHDMILVGDSFTTSHFGATVWSGHPDGYEDDMFGLDTVRNLGQRVAEISLKIHG
jgi:multimeric flavodoxin WrbA